MIHNAGSCDSLQAFFFYFMKDCFIIGLFHEICNLIINVDTKYQNKSGNNSYSYFTHSKTTTTMKDYHETCEMFVSNSE